MPKFCEYCGTPLKEGAKFCVGCGHPVSQMSQPYNQNMNKQRTYAPQTPNVAPTLEEPRPYAQQPSQQSHQQPYQQPSQQPFQHPSTQPPQKKDNTLLIVLIALAVVLFIVKIIQIS